MTVTRHRRQSADNMFSMLCHQHAAAPTPPSRRLQVALATPATHHSKAAVTSPPRSSHLGVEAPKTTLETHLVAAASTLLPLRRLRVAAFTMAPNQGPSNAGSTPFTACSPRAAVTLPPTAKHRSPRAVLATNVTSRGSLAAAATPIFSCCRQAAALMPPKRCRPSMASESTAPSGRETTVAPAVSRRPRVSLATTLKSCSLRQASAKSSTTCRLRWAASSSFTTCRSR